MRQVPREKILIIGNGRAAKHIHFYLTQLHFDIRHWHSKDLNPRSISFPSTSDKELQQKMEELRSLHETSHHTLLLIKDSAIEEFLIRYPFLRTSKTLHFSGSLDIPGVANIHPLISFGDDLFEPDFYPQIPFAHFDSSSHQLTDYLPGLPNPSFYIPKNAKALYHGLCVASGNLTVLLWQAALEEFKKNFAIHDQILMPYLESITLNLKTNWNKALTGPIARRDEITLEKNFEALKNTNLNEIFTAHIKLAWPEFASKYFSSNVGSPIKTQEKKSHDTH